MVPSPEMTGRPNLLWLFCDQLRYHALACNGDRNVPTPNLDRLAAEGVRCTHAVMRSGEPLPDVLIDQEEWT